MNDSHLFAHVARTQDRALAADSIAREATRTRILQAVTAPPKAATRSLRTWLWAAATATAAVAVISLSWFGPSARKAPVIPPSTWVVAADTPEIRRFADRSSVALAPYSSARIHQSAPHVVRMVLEKGSAEVRVTPSSRTHWLVEAGPYEVRVTGTRFTLSWNMEQQRFHLVLQKGKVILFGPMVENGTSVEAGEQVTAWVADRQFAMSGRTSPTPDAPIPAVSPDPLPPSPSPTTRNAPRSKSRQAPTPAPAPAPRWKTLCRQGAFSQVIAEATDRGLHRVLRKGSLADLSALGEAARLTRNRTVAWDTYVAIRTRFPQTGAATQAAFFLGKIAFDQRHAYATAATWFSTYLAEAPNGRYRKEALGRLMESLSRSGDRTAAARIAKQYLNHYPKGIHADMARAISRENP